MVELNVKPKKNENRGFFKKGIPPENRRKRIIGINNK